MSTSMHVQMYRGAQYIILILGNIPVKFEDSRPLGVGAYSTKWGHLCGEISNNLRKKHNNNNVISFIYLGNDKSQQRGSKSAENIFCK